MKMKIAEKIANYAFNNRLCTIEVHSHDAVFTAHSQTDSDLLTKSCTPIPPPPHKSGALSNFRMQNEAWHSFVLHAGELMTTPAIF